MDAVALNHRIQRSSCIHLASVGVTLERRPVFRIGELQEGKHNLASGLQHPAGVLEIKVGLGMK